MPLQLTITAQSLEELWNTLSTFPQLAQTLAVKDQQDLAGQGFVPQADADTSTADTGAADGAGPTGPAGPAPKSNGGEIKRGPGRPPGSTNKPKAVAAKPEPEDDAVAADADDDTEMEGNEDDTRAAITAELGKYWKMNTNFKGMIQAFRSQIGISTMLELQPKDFPKARALIANIKEMVDMGAPDRSRPGA